MNQDRFSIVQVTEADALNAVRLLFTEYAKSLSVSLWFQNFDAELANLPGDYAQPRGALLAARTGSTWVGCGALRPLDTVDYPNASEMKRLYVKPGCRGLGLGRALAEAILDAARTAGYSYVLLDTLSDMESARALYEELGFAEIAPYYHNPIEGAHYLMATL